MQTYIEEKNQSVEIELEPTQKTEFVDKHIGPFTMTTLPTFKEAEQECVFRGDTED